MANTINDNAFVKQLFDIKAQNPNNKPGQDISELAKAKLEADVDYSPTARGSAKAASMMQMQQAYQYSETMSLQLTTKEGDKVTLDFRQLYAQYQSYQEMKLAEDGPSGVGYFESKQAMEATMFEERFAFSVQGDLNEEELQAIYDVFAKVDELAGEFYGGNIEKALEKAQNLELDMEQLSGMSLNLTQTETVVKRYQQQALAQYQNVQNDTEGGEADAQANAENADPAALPNYYDTWQQVLERLDEQFANAESFFNELMADINAQRFPEQDSRPGWLERVRSFHEELAQLAQQKSEQSPQLEATENSEPAVVNDENNPAV